jgi:hypothetical protein
MTILIDKKGFEEKGSDSPLAIPQITANLKCI